MAKWYEEAAFYHIYPLGLLGAPRRNEGGDIVHRLPALTEQWLPHIRDLGCRAVYIGPLFESCSHGYDTTDYRQIDRRLGDQDDFRRFTEKAHGMGIRVVVDGVFNHTGREFFAFRDLREKKWDSHYREWYKWVNFDNDSGYGDGFSYESWHGCGELANLNLWNEEVRSYLLDVADFWIDSFDIDGIRLDCADSLDFSFMEALRQRTARKKEDFWLMGEVIHGDYSRWIGDGQHLLHSVTNYELWKGLWSGHNSHNYFEIAHTIRREFGDDWGLYKGMKLYTFADNHDVNRIASQLTDPRCLQAVYTLVYLLPGIPSVYYGSEFGIRGRKEDGGDDCLRPALLLPEDPASDLHTAIPCPQLIPWLRLLAAIRQEHPACINGQYRELYLTNRQYAFLRTEGSDAVLAAVNNDEQDAELRIPVPELPCDAGACQSAGRGPGLWRNAATGEEIRSDEGILCLRLPAAGAAVWIYDPSAR